METHFSVDSHGVKFRGGEKDQQTKTQIVILLSLQGINRGEDPREVI
jgi:hypothetical protein